jgi:GNAT superfamily N-acetyltransferase
MQVRLVTFAKRPDLVEAAFALGPPEQEFMQHPDIGYLYNAGLDTCWSEYAMTVLQGDAVIGRAMTVPFVMGSPGREHLPDRGWDEVIRWAAEDQIAGTPPNKVAALEITLDPSLRGKGLSGVVLAAVRDNCERLGFGELVCPVRPTEKARYPEHSMTEYAALVRADGLPQDPWLRVHVRAGGEVMRIAERSMTITGSLDDWRAWTGLPFADDGPSVVEGALVPVIVSQARSLAVYIEPNVWVRHALG